MTKPPGGHRTWTVVDDAYRTVGPVEEWLEAHRAEWSPNTIRSYATALAQWWSFLEQRGEAAKWRDLGVPAVAAYLSWLRNDRSAERIPVVEGEPPQDATLASRLAALMSFYRWQDAVHEVPVAKRLLRGAPRRIPFRGLLTHLDPGVSHGPSSLVRVRRIRRRDRPPILLPQQIQAILDGCAVWDDEQGQWCGNLRDRFLFALLADSGMRIGEALGLRIRDFVMGQGSTPHVEIVPREDNANGARVKMMRARRVYLGADLERLYADYLTHLAVRAAELGLPISPEDPLFVNLERPPLLAALREGTVRDKVAAGSARRAGVPTGSATATPAPCCWPARRTGWSPAASGTLTCKPPWTFTAGSVRTRPCGRRRTGRPTPRDGGSSMTGDRTARRRLVPTAVADPVARLLVGLPPQWHGEVIGPGIEGWESMVESGRDRALRLQGLPARLRLELAWMANWQSRDGLKVSVDVCNQLAALLAWAAETGHPLPESLAWADKQELLRLHGIWFHTRHGRLPAAVKGRRARLERMLGYPRLALRARLHDGAWWELDTWHPRCDPRIPLREREPCRSVGCSPGDAQLPWVRNALKWHLGVLLESGTLTWSTLSGQRSSALLRFARWLETLPEPAEVIRDASRAGSFAAAFRRWISDPVHRSSVGRPPEAVAAGKVNLDLWAVAELMAFLIDHRQEAAQVLGPSPWDGLTDAHPAIWLRQRTRLRRHQPVADETHYVDDQALAQITACLPALGEPSTRTVTVASGGATRVLAGQDDPQLMRMLLLQILTGRRASEICLCSFDCLSPATDSAVEAAEGDAVARFRYGQSKIDKAPDTILVDAETVAVIEEQQRWLRDRFPGRDLRYLFPQRRANAHGAKPYGNSNYARALGLFSELA